MYTEIDGWRSLKNDICLKSAKKQGNGDINNYQNIELMTAMDKGFYLRDRGLQQSLQSQKLS